MASAFLFILEYSAKNHSDFPYYYFAKFKLLRNIIHKSSIYLHFSCTPDHFFDGSEIKITFLGRHNIALLSHRNVCSLSRRNMRPAKPP